MIWPQQNINFIHPLILIFFSLVTVFTLFYLDEGYYSFQWMKQPGNWIVFSIYSVFCLAGQMTFDGILCTDQSSWFKKIFIINLGGFIGCFVLIYLWS